MTQKYVVQSAMIMNEGVKKLMDTAIPARMYQSCNDCEWNHIPAERDINTKSSFISSYTHVIVIHSTQWNINRHEIRCEFLLDTRARPPCQQESWCRIWKTLRMKSKIKTMWLEQHNGSSISSVTLCNSWATSLYCHQPKTKFMYIILSSSFETQGK